MINFDYVPKGLYAMARAHRVNTMSGHLGAAVLAGYFIGEQHPDLDTKVYEGIESELDRIIRGEHFIPPENSAISATQMFEAFAKEQPKENLIDGIADALAHNIDQTRQSGHNVIFAAIAIRALKDHSDFATPSVIEGIRELIAGFNDESPGSGYYGKQKGRVDGRKIPLPKDNTFPPYPDIQTMANIVLDELIQYESQRRWGYGGFWHVINHAAALAELAHYGYLELAIKGLPAHHQHLSLYKALPNVADELGAETPTEHDPRTPEFWKPNDSRRESTHLTHRIKTIYGFDTLVELVEDHTKRDQSNDKLRFLM